MYKAKFVDAQNNVFLFDVANGIVFDIEGLSGISVDHTMAQGVQQIGETVSVRSVGSKSLTVTGVIYRNIVSTKRRMRNIFAPFVSGRLIFNDKYYLDVSVKDTPSMSPEVDRGTFTMQLLAPYPFFKMVEESVVRLGGAVKLFRFPINYTDTHTFADRGAERYVNVINNGDVDSDFVMTISTTSVSQNPRITNLNTLEFLQINRTLYEGEQIKIWRDENGVLMVSLIDEDGGDTDVFSDLDENSNLFALHRGDNVLGASAQIDGETVYNLMVLVSFNPAVVGVFDEN